MATRVIFNAESLQQVRIPFTASKSISNRALVISYLGGLNDVISQLSDADDTLALQQALSSNDSTINVGEGGTTARFLMAACCALNREVILEAADSLKNRPMAGLVDALNALGAKITYVEKEGFLPVRISKSNMHGGEVHVNAGVSSQFISALMMIGPLLESGLTIHLEGETVSVPYINMTADIMRHYGSNVVLQSNQIMVAQGKYLSKPFEVEADWSGTSYWFEAAALMPGSSIFLEGVKPSTLQGDMAILKIMEPLGVSSRFLEEGLLLQGSGKPLVDYFLHDFTDCPDLAPAVAVACAGLNITADLTGLKNLRLKECDRALALQRGLYDLGVNTDFCGGSKFKVYPGRGPQPTNRIIRTFDDHRIIMAFSMMALKTDYIDLDHSNGVSKSYPGFFSDLFECGFEFMYF